jgi:hypothetical protein
VTNYLNAAFSITDTVIMFFGMVMVLYGQYYFKEGLLVKTLQRAFVVSVIILLHFFLGMLNDLSLVVVPSAAGNFLELAFTVGLVYLTYAFVNDWRNLGK